MTISFDSNRQKRKQGKHLKILVQMEVIVEGRSLELIADIDETVARPAVMMTMTEEAHPRQALQVHPQRQQIQLKMHPWHPLCLSRLQDRHVPLTTILIWGDQQGTQGVSEVHQMEAEALTQMKAKARPKATIILTERGFMTFSRERQ